MNSPRNSYPPTTAWQCLAVFAVAPTSAGYAQAKGQIATVASDLALPAPTVDRLTGALGEALHNALAHNQRCGLEAAIWLQVHVCRLPTPTASRGWGFFLVERLAEPARNRQPTSPHRIALYLYQEGTGHGR